jgi:Flp pilus assembly protein TadG
MTKRQPDSVRRIGIAIPPQRRLGPRLANHCRTRSRRRRSGQVLVLLLVSLASILGVVGLVLDSGLLMSGAQDLHHATDAAAMAAAMDLRLGKTSAQATATATLYIQSVNGFTNTSVTVNIPPLQGAYAGQANYVEVIASGVYQTQIMQIVGALSQQSFQVRSVAGCIASTAGAAIDALDPSPPSLSISSLPPVVPAYSGLIGGLEVLGAGTASVNGAVLVNTSWGGVDENGNPAGSGAGPPYGISCTPLLPLTHLNALNIRVVGGVDSASNYSSYTAGAKSPLYCNQLPVPDPYESLPVPTTTSDPTNVSTQSYGSVQVVQLPLVGSATVLQPGVYDWIEIDSGTVTFTPGIYIVTGSNSLTGAAVNILGGTVTANGVMFYVTNSSNYSPVTGLPDSGDGDSKPPTLSSDSLTPSVIINAALPGGSFSGLASAGSPFNGMLVYQRRADYGPIVIVQTSLLGASSLSGALYAKWGQVVLAGNGTYNVSIVAGSVRLAPVLSMTLAPATLLSPAQDVYLVE